MPQLAGILSALVTPFDTQGRLAAHAVPDLVALELAQGIDGFYVGGSTGEAFLQTLDERAEMLRAVAAAVGGRARLVAHVGAIATHHAVALAEVAAESGYDAVSSVPPFYYGFGAAEIADHYRALAQATGLPVILYNIPGFSGVRLATATVLELLAVPGIAGIKHTSSDFHQLERIKAAAPGAVAFNGLDEMMLAGLAMGADGAIGSTFNYMGHLFVAIAERFRAGRMDEARALQARANEIIDVVIEIGVLPATKALLAIQGVDCGACRAPFRAPTPDQMRRLEAVAGSL